MNKYNNSQEMLEDFDFLRDNEETMYHDTSYND